MTAKPSLGYPTRTDAVLALRREKLSTREIASRLGIDPKTVTALESSAGRKLRPAEQLGRTILFPVDILDALAPYAARRNCHVNQLARRIVEQVVDDGIVDAVMDDAESLS
jgi:transcriptional regulator with XRE-family HTH domain